MNITFREISEDVISAKHNKADIDIESIIADLFGQSWHLGLIDDDDCDRITCYYFSANNMFHKMYFLDDVPVAIGIPEDYRDDILYNIKWFGYEAERSVMQYLDSIAYAIMDKRDADERLNLHYYYKYYINLDGCAVESISDLI